jgi:hypothetical protein
MSNERNASLKKQTTFCDAAALQNKQLELYTLRRKSYQTTRLECRYGNSDRLSITVADADIYFLHSSLLGCCSCFATQLIVC